MPFKCFIGTYTFLIFAFFQLNSTTYLKFQSDRRQSSASKSQKVSEKKQTSCARLFDDQSHSEASTQARKDNGRTLGNFTRNKKGSVTRKPISIGLNFFKYGCRRDFVQSVRIKMKRTSDSDDLRMQKKYI